MFDWFAFSRDHFWIQASDKRREGQALAEGQAGQPCFRWNFLRRRVPVPNCTNSSTWHPESVPGNFMIARQVWLSGSTPLLCVYVCAHMCVWLELTSDWVITIIQTGPLPSYLHSASSAVFISTTTELLQSFNYLDNSPFFAFVPFFFFFSPSPLGCVWISAVIPLRQQSDFCNRKFSHFFFFE